MASATKTTKGYAKAQKQMSTIETSVGLFEVDRAKFDVDRMTGADPRDPRTSGDPCQGAHEPARPGRGSPTGSNSSAMWVACRKCQLRLLYIPSFGSTGLHRQAGPLPSDTKAKVEELGKQASYHPELKSKTFALDAAEVSAIKKLEGIRAQKEKINKKVEEPKPKPLTKPSAVVELDPEDLRVTPGRKATRKNELSAEEQEYQGRSSEHSWSPVTDSPARDP